MTTSDAITAVNSVQDRIVDAIELADSILGTGPLTDGILEAAIGGLGCVETLLGELLDRLQVAEDAGKDHAP